MLKMCGMFVILSIGVSFAYAATPVRSNDGVIQFASATVGGINAWSIAERDALIAEHPTDPVVNFTLTSFEIMASTTLVFGSIMVSVVDDFRQTLSSKPFIVQKGIDVAADLVAVERIQVLYPALPTQGTINKFKAQLNLLVAIWNSL